MCINKLLVFNWTVSDTQQYLKPFNFDLRWAELLEIELFDHFTVCVFKICLHVIYLIYLYMKKKKDLALNNQEKLLCHKTKTQVKIQGNH